jgi:RND family efflux transporter MFP subunit
MTLLVAVAALVAARWMWIRYEIEPWTRDGRVRADVVQVAPDVSGLVIDVAVRNDQSVRRGQTLFTLDRPRFQLALEQAEAAVSTQQAALAQARREDRRNRSLGDLVATETTEQGASRVSQLEAAAAQAIANRDAARLNLTRTMVPASVDGVVANVELRPGDYAAAGRAAMALVDTGSLHVDGYFEETKLPRIRIGDPADVRLMGEHTALSGHVVSIAPAVEDRERQPSPNLIANVNPTFSWVRLAQRVPVRVVIDRLPPGVQLIAGRTATVEIRPRPGPGRPAEPRLWPW